MHAPDAAARPQAGWSLHTSRPTGGRLRRTGQVPAATSPVRWPHTTQTNINQLFNYFQLTGDKKYLARIPEAIAWLKAAAARRRSHQNPLLGGGRTHPTFVELGTNDGLYMHRYGSNIHNGAYYADKDYTNTISHYSAGRAINIAGMEATTTSSTR